MLSKRKIINTLFILAFPWYGVGGYVMMLKGFAVGVFTCALPFLLILAVYLLDMLYGQAPIPRVNRRFYLVMAFLASMSASVFLGLYYKSPVITPLNGALLIMLFHVPFLSSVLVQTYNRNDPDFDMTWMLMKGFIVYLVINLAGMAAGLHNLMHYFPGRANPPFALGLYDTAHTLAIVNLMLLPFLTDFRANPLRWTGLAALYAVNMGIILSINSRLSVMIFLVFSVLFATRAMKVLRGFFTVSLFTMPIMMTFALLIYEILTMPPFVALMERVDKKDITTFNGRTYIWESAAGWLADDRRGLIFGNGYNGQYHLRLLDWVARLWGESGSFRLHMHSAFLEFLVDQGIVGIGLLYGVYWSGYRFYRKQYMANSRLAPVYAAFVYLMFAWQIDIFGYGIYSGFVLVFMLMGPVVMQAREEGPAGAIEMSGHK